MSKNRIRVKPGMTLSLPVVLRVTVGSLLVWRKIVERYEERILAGSRRGERFVFLGTIPRGKGVER